MVVCRGMALDAERDAGKVVGWTHLVLCSSLHERDNALALQGRGLPLHGYMVSKQGSERQALLKVKLHH